MSYMNTWEKDGLYRKFSESISGEEILESNFELQIDPRFKDIKYIINDFTDVTDHMIQTEHTQTYASTDEIISHSKGRLKIAIVVTQDSLIALAKNYQEEMRGKLFECEIFKTIDSAREWVNV